MLNYVRTFYTPRMCVRGCMCICVWAKSYREKQVDATVVDLISPSLSHSLAFSLSLAHFHINTHTST